VIFAVTLKRGGPWDWSRELREQQGFDQHGRFMDELVEQRLVLLGGPLALDREVLLIIQADSEEQARERLAADPWQLNGMLTVSSVRAWTVLLDGLGVNGEKTAR